MDGRFKRSILLMILSCFTLSCAHPSFAASPAPQYWFCPGDPATHKVPAVNYMGLFDDAAQWSNARSHIQVFKIYPGIVVGAPDAYLQKIFQYLDRHHIALALEWGMLTTSPACGKGVEGYAQPADAAKVAARIKMFDGNLRYIAMDEPLYFGHYYKGKDACQSDISSIARNVAANIKAFKAVFPDIQVGDIEPIGPGAPADWEVSVRNWIVAYRTAVGTPLAFYHADVKWKDPGNLTQLKALLAAADIPMGMIVNGSEDATSDKAWMAEAEQNIRTLNTSGLNPSQVVFQSWDAYPKTLVPESDSNAMTYLVNFYFSQN